MKKLKQVSSLSCNDVHKHEPDQLAIHDVKWLLHNRPAREVVHFDDDIFVSRHTRGLTRYNIWDLENGKILARDANAFTWWPNLLVAAWFAVDTTGEYCAPGSASRVYTKSIVICSTYTCKNAPRIVLDNRPELLPQVNITCLGVVKCDHAFCHARREASVVDEPPCLRYRVELFYANGGSASERSASERSASTSEVLEVIV